MGPQADRMMPPSGQANGGNVLIICDYNDSESESLESESSAARAAAFLDSSLRTRQADGRLCTEPYVGVSVTDPTTYLQDTASRGGDGD